MRVIVIGGSAAGLATAPLLARAGHEVEVLDRDELEPAPARGVVRGLDPSS